MLTTRLRRAASGDRGAVAVIVVIFFASLVLFAAAALAVDTGQFYAEKAQLQNGADSGAYAVAETCAKGACNTALAATYANANANDNASAVEPNNPCGNVTGLSPCGADLCPKTKPASGPWLDLQVETKTSDGKNVLPSFFARAVLGNKYNGTIHACARATWGAPVSCGNCVPMTISLCEWYADTNDNQTFATAPTNGTYAKSTSPFVSVPSYLDTITARRASPLYSNGTGNYYIRNNIKDPHNPVLNAPNGYPVAGAETVLLAHSAGTTGFGGSNCNGGTDGSNQTAPGQFGWLCKSGNNCGGGPCTAAVNGITYGGSPGSPPPNCETVFTNSRNNMKPIFIPVYSSVSGTGSNTQYTLAGFAAFVVTGWGGLNSGQGFSTVSCDSIITLSDRKPPDTSLNWKNGLPANTSCSGGGNGNNDFANYCANFMGNNNCNGNSTQAVYGYFTKTLIPPGQLPGGGTGGKDLGATSVQLIG
jgi:hypothetical protein